MLHIESQTYHGGPVGDLGGPGADPSRQGNEEPGSHGRPVLMPGGPRAPKDGHQPDQHEQLAPEQLHERVEELGPTVGLNLRREE